MTAGQKAVIQRLAEQAEDMSRLLVREVDAGNLMNADWYQQCAEFAALQAFAVARVAE